MNKKLLAIFTLVLTLFIGGCSFSFDKNSLINKVNLLEKEVKELKEENEELDKARDIIDFYNELTTETLDSTVVIRSSYYGSNKKYSNGIIIGSSGFDAYILADYNAIKQTSSASYVLIDSYANEYSAYLYEVDITTGLAIFTCNWDYYGSVIGLGEYSEVVAKVDNVSWIHKTTIESNIKSSTMTYFDTTYKSYCLNDMNLNGGTIFINDQNKIIGMYSSKLNVIVSEKVLELIINF